jgi:hypothetical protein
MAALKNLQKELEKRILQRERKSAIYASYRGDKNQAAIGAMLAQIPTIMRRQKYRNLNLALVVCLSILALLRLAVALFLIFAQVPLGFFLIFPGLFIIGYLIWAVHNYVGLGYFMTFVLGIVGLLNTLKGLAFNPTVMGLLLDGLGAVAILIAIILAKILMQSLLPQTTFFMKPKVDSQGNPVFEDS